MADALFIVVNAQVKANNVTIVKSDGLKKAAIDTMTAAINSKSSNRLTTKTKQPNGFTLAVNITLKGDDAKTPKKLELTISGSTMINGHVEGHAFNFSGAGKIDALSNNIQRDAEDLVSGVLDSVIASKAIPAMK